MLSDHAFLKFDSIPSASVSLHGSAKFHECMAIGKSEGTTMWEKSSDIRIWIHVRCPKHEDGWSCGYYVMCFVTMYMAFQMGDDVMDWTCEVCTFPTVFYYCSRPLGHFTTNCLLEDHNLEATNIDFLSVSDYVADVRRFWNGRGDGHETKSETRCCLRNAHKVGR